MHVAFHLVSVHSAPFSDLGKAQQGGMVSWGLFCAMQGTRQRELWPDGGTPGLPGVPQTEQLLTQLSPDVAEVLSLFIGLGGVGDPSQEWGALHIVK